MNCSNQALPNKAICEQCFQDTKERLLSKQQAWREGNRSGEQKTETVQILFQKAPLVSRLLAFMIDSLILSIVSLSIFWISSRQIFDPKVLANLKNLPKDPENIKKLLESVKLLAALNFTITAFPAWCYYVFFECSGPQATPGKRLLGLRVYSIRRIDLVLSSNRFFIKNISYIGSLVLIPLLSTIGLGLNLLIFPILLILAIIALIGLINPFVILFSKNRRGIHDLIAGTQVIIDHSVGFIRMALAWLAWIILVALYIGLCFLMK